MVSTMARGVLWPEYCLSGVSYFYYPNTLFLVCLFYLHYSNEPEVFLPKYSQTAIPHAAHFRRVVKMTLDVRTLQLHTLITRLLMVRLLGDFLLAKMQYPVCTSMQTP